MNNWCTPPTNMYKEKNKNKDAHSRSWKPTQYEDMEENEAVVPWDRYSENRPQEELHH